jgi:hypothetical protein
MNRTMNFTIIFILILVIIIAYLSVLYNINTGFDSQISYLANAFG